MPVTGPGGAGKQGTARPGASSLGAPEGASSDDRGAAGGRSGKIAGLDFGQARIGVALSDELGLLAHPRPFIPSKPPERALAQLSALVRSEGIERFIVGLPRHLSGEEGASAVVARKFARAVEKATQIPVELVDERLSTVEAHARLRESGHDARAAKTRVDSAAAALLLQAWLDARARPSGGSPGGSRA